MQEDDEFDQIRVCLLPEGFLASAEEVVQQRCDVVRQSVGVEVVVERVVAIFGIEADFDVVLGPVVALKNSSHLVAEVSLHFQHQSADPFLFVICPVGENLLRKWVHAAARLAGADCANDCGACEERPFRERQPLRVFRRCGLTLVVNLADDQEKIIAFAGSG